MSGQGALKLSSALSSPLLSLNVGAPPLLITAGFLMAIVFYSL